MKRIASFLFFILSIVQARDISNRIQALGESFYLLIPDYETEVLFNPLFFDKSLVGVHYKTSQEIPVKLTLLYHKIGLHGMYWPSYTYQLNRDPSPGGNWTSQTSFSERLKLTAMIRIKNFGFSVTPDIYHSQSEERNSNDYTAINRNLDMLYKMSFGYRVFNNFQIFADPAVLLKEVISRVQNYDEVHQKLIVPSGKLIVMFRHSSAINRFVSIFCECGGPTSLEEIGLLPISLVKYMPERDTLVLPFGNSFKMRAGSGFGMPLDDKSLVAIGIVDEIQWQRLNAFSFPVIADSFDRSESHEVSIPLAIEYIINKFFLRFGIGFSYSFKRMSRFTYEIDEYKIQSQSLTHNVGYAYSFGFGWAPKERVAVHLRYSNMSWWFAFSGWSVYVEYTF